MILSFGSYRRISRQNLLVAAVSFFVVGVAATGTASASTPAQKVLVGMGDSYAAGPGPYTSASMKDECWRSISGAYPQIAAKALGYKEVHVACSGAGTSAFTKSFKTEKAQDLSIGNADAIVITIGANDVNLIGTWNTLGTKGSAANKKKALDDFNSAVKNRLPDSLNNAFASVKAKAPKAKVFVTGYGNAFPTSQAVLDSCLKDGAQNVTAKELNDLDVNLNNAIASAAKRAGFTYVDVAATVHGHDMCTNVPYAGWVSEVAGKPSPSLHPTVAGHVAIGKQLASVITKALPPTPKPTSTTSRSTTSTTSRSTTTTSTSTSTTSSTVPASSTTSTVPSTTSTSTTTSTTSSTTTSTVPDTGSTVSPTPIVTIVVSPSQSSSPVGDVGDDGNGDVDTDTSTTTSSVPPSLVPTQIATEQLQPASDNTSVSNDQVVSGDQTASNGQLAMTGTNVTGDIALGAILLGIGLGLLWLQFVVRDKLAKR